VINDLIELLVGRLNVDYAAHNLAAGAAN